MEINDILDMSIGFTHIIIWVAMTLIGTGLLSFVAFHFKSSLAFTVLSIGLCAWIAGSIVYHNSIYDRQKNLISKRIHEYTRLVLTDGLDEDDYYALITGNGYAEFRISKNNSFYTVIAENHNKYVNFYQYYGNGIYLKMNSGTDLKFPDIADKLNNNNDNSGNNSNSSNNNDSNYSSDSSNNSGNRENNNGNNIGNNNGINNDNNSSNNKE